MDLDALINKHYGVQLSSAELLEEQLEILVDEVMGGFTGIIKEKEGKTKDEVTFTLSMIPEIEVSEIGWSDVRTPDGTGTPIKSRERKLLEDYLHNIIGDTGGHGLDTLPEKLSRLTNFYENPEQYLGKSETTSAKIQQAMSLLVFYKTLTKIIANFNASSAGFSFESFMATLLDGVQVPANTGTIADFYAGGTDGEPVSLKLYNEKGVEVGGSFVDLVGDLLNDSKDNRMTYLVVMKNLRGSREKLTGSLTFYQFDITLENVMKLLKDTKAFSARCIILADEISGEPQKIPARINRMELRKERFEEYLLQLTTDKQLVDTLLQNSYFQLGSDENREIVTTDFKFPTRGPKLELITQILKELLDIETEDALKVVATLRSASAQADSDVKETVAARKEKVGALTPSLQKYSKIPSSEKKKKTYQKSVKKAADISERAYEQMSSKDEKKQALLKTNGYLNELQFSIGKREVKDLAEPMGKLEIGDIALQKMLNETTKLLNSEVFSIFQALRSLSDNLNGFFASGLADDDKASDAIGDAKDIESKTEKVKTGN